MSGFEDLDLIWLLNQYRSAEIRGAGVILRLGRLADSSEMRSNFSRHLRDEAVHAWLWTRAIDDLGGEVSDVADPYQSRLGTHFGIPKTLAEFLAVTLASEQRGVAMYRMQLDIGDNLPIVERTLRGILKDEEWHVEWIGEELDKLAEHDPSVADAVARAQAADLAALAELEELARASAP